MSVQLFASWYVNSNISDGDFLLTVFQDMVRRGEIIDDSMDDEFYLRRLDAGLFVLQLICYIMVEICSAGVPQVHTHTHTKSEIMWQKRSCTCWMMCVFVSCSYSRGFIRFLISEEDLSKLSVISWEVRRADTERDSRPQRVTSSMCVFICAEYFIVNASWI